MNQHVAAELAAMNLGAKLAAVCPVSATASPLATAIAEHLKAEERLYAELSRDKNDPVRIALADAEERAHQAAIAAPLRDRTDLVAFYEHFSNDAEEGDILAKALDALALALQVGAQAEAEIATAAVAPENRLSPRQAAIELHTLAFRQELAPLSPIQIAIALHRCTWQTLQASNAFLDATGKADRKALAWPAEEAEDEALTDLLMLSVRSRQEAKAMVAHLTWYLGVRPQHPKGRALSEADGALIAVRLRDLGMILGRELPGAGRAAEPGAMTGLIAAHRAAWSAYRAAPDAEVTGWETYGSLRDGAGMGSEAVLLAPCADRAEASAFIEHARWYAAELEAVGEKLADGFGYESRQMLARAGDLAVHIGADPGEQSAQAALKQKES